MRLWISCRSMSERQKVRSIKLTRAMSRYYKLQNNARLASVFYKLQTVYIDLWDTLNTEDLVLASYEESRACWLWRRRWFKTEKERTSRVSRLSFTVYSLYSGSSH
ncbi:hypothetical protein M3J09_003160 [Ascochyta lentis]